MGELVDVIDAGDRVGVVIRPMPGAELRANLTTFGRRLRTLGAWMGGLPAEPGVPQQRPNRPS